MCLEPRLTGINNQLLYQESFAVTVTLTEPSIWKFIQTYIVTELLRRVCDNFLDEVIQHIFLRLPEFVESQKDIKRAVRKVSNEQ